MPYNIFNVPKVEGSLKQRLNDFIFSFGHAISSGAGIAFADRDINYALHLQHERIREKAYVMEYEAYDRGVLTDVYAGGEWRDGHYESTMCFTDCGIKRTVIKGGKKLYGDDRKLVFYETLTDVISGTQPENDSYCCPNCGAVTTIGELVSGCQYCGTRYKMNDLFPKITAFYAIDDMSRSEEEMKPIMKRYMITTALVLAVIGIVGNIIKGTYSDISEVIGYIPQIILTLIFSAIMGVFLGYMLFSVSLIFSAFGKAFKTGDMLGTIGSRKKFERKMRARSPEFSFEYFTSKATSLIKTVIFSPDEQDLVYYKGEKTDPRFKDIIDLNYSGALGVVKFEEKNGITTVVTDAFFDILYAKDDRISSMRRVFRTTFTRR
ncbi:MAG: hypothetical protein K5686_11865, partial [Lachnospiraceae bacterium]|nr:hypothetical protein [Lachnospiraceae bacterium]